MRIRGHFGDGRRSRAEAAELLVVGGRASVTSLDGVLRLGAIPLASISVTSRLGDTPRHLYFSDGSSFTTDDNASVDLAFAEVHPGTGWLYRLESRWRIAALALLVSVGVIAAGIHWGVPNAARHVAAAVPPSVNVESERLALQFLDSELLQPSRLAPSERERLLRLLRPVLAEQALELPLRVVFRDAAHSFGANALALPGGTIVLTDQLIGMAQHDEELMAIVAHEVGHIVERHATRRALQASMLSLFAALAFGDISSVSAAATSVPIFLTELGYSRQFEREADLHAVSTLARLGIPPTRLADILQRLDPSHGGHGYLSTHPPTPERIEAIRRDATGHPR